MQQNIEASKTALDNFVITQSIIFDGINDTRKNLHKIVINMAEREQEGDLKQFLRRETMVAGPNFKINMHNPSTASKRELDRILGSSNDGVEIEENPDEGDASLNIRKGDASKSLASKFYSVAGMSDLEYKTG